MGVGSPTADPLPRLVQNPLVVSVPSVHIRPSLGPGQRSQHAYPFQPGSWFLALGFPLQSGKPELIEVTWLRTEAGAQALLWAVGTVVAQCRAGRGGVAAGP